MKLLPIAAIAAPFALTASALAGPPAASRLDIATGVACFNAIDALQGNNGFMWGSVVYDGEARIDGEDVGGAYVFHPNGQVRFFPEHNTFDFYAPPPDEEGDLLPPDVTPWEQGRNGVLTPQVRAILATDLYRLLQESRHATQTAAGEDASTFLPSATTTLSGGPGAGAVGLDHAEQPPAPQPLTQRELQLAAMIELQTLSSVPLPDQEQSESIEILREYFRRLGEEETRSIEQAVSRLTPDEKAELVRRKRETMHAGPAAQPQDSPSPSPLAEELSEQVEAIVRELPEDALAVELKADPARIRTAVETCNRVTGDPRIERYVDEWLAELPAAPAPAANPSPQGAGKGE